MTIPARHAALVAALFLAAPAASAQTAPPEVPSKPIPGWTFTPGVTIATMHDSNIALRNAPAGGSTQGDVVFTIDPSGSLRYTGKYTEASTDYRGRFRRYQQFDTLDSFEQRWGVNVQHRASQHVSLFAQNTYSRVPTTDDLDLAGAPFVRSGVRSDRAGAGVTAQVRKHTQLAARYDFTAIGFDRPELPGGWIQGATGELTQELGGRLRAGAEGGLHVASLADGTRSLRFVDGGGVLMYELTQFTDVRVAAGLSVLDDRTTGLTRTGPYVRGSISKLSEYTVVGASFERSFVPAFGFGGVARNQEVHGWVTLPRLARRVFAQAAGTWRRTYPFDVESLQLDTIQFHGAVGYALAPSMRIQGFYTFTRQDSIVTGGEINRSRIGAELVLAHPMRIQ